MGKMGKFENRQKFEHNGQTVYEWEQSMEEVLIYIVPPPGAKARDIECKITVTHLTLGMKGNPPFLNHDTGGPVVIDESMWTLGACCAQRSLARSLACCLRRRRWDQSSGGAAAPPITPPFPPRSRSHAPRPAAHARTQLVAPPDPLLSAGTRRPCHSRLLPLLAHRPRARRPPLCLRQPHQTRAKLKSTCRR